VFIKALFTKQQEDTLDCLSMATIFNTLVNLLDLFNRCIYLNNNDCCIESLSIDSCSSLQFTGKAVTIKTINYLSKDQNLYPNFARKY
jgi:hypothetical protein